MIKAQSFSELRNIAIDLMKALKLDAPLLKGGFVATSETVTFIGC